MTDQNQLGRELAKIFSDPNEFIGVCSGSVESDGTVNVVRPDGTSVNAKLANAGRGTKTLCQCISGVWYAWREGESNIESERTVLERRSRPTTQEESGLVKVLFYLQENGLYNFYVGGDRAKPKKIYSTPDLPNAYFSNLGRGLNNWVAGFKNETTVQNIFGNKTYTCNDSLAAPSLIWRGAGLWTYILQGDVVSVNYTSLSSAPDYNSARGWVIGETNYSSDFVSAVVGLSATGRTIGYTKNVTVADGNVNDPVPFPGSNHSDHQYFTVENKTFSFYKNFKTYTNQSSYDSNEITSSAAGTQVNSSSRNQTSSQVLSIVFLEKPLSIHEEQVNSSSYSENYVGPAGSQSGSTQQISLDLLITGINTWIYKKTETNQVIGGQNTTFRNLILEKTSNQSRETLVNYSYTNQYPQLLNSISKELGATLKSSRYYMLPPSEATTDYYGTGLWTDKSKSNYSLNFYENPNFTGIPTKIPVWVAHFKEDSIEILADIEAKVYPLPSNAVVIAASYCN